MPASLLVALAAASSLITATPATDPAREIATTEARAAATGKAFARLTARIAATESAILAAQARVELIDAQIRAQNALLAREQTALTPMLAALASRAERPWVLLLLRPETATENARVGIALDAMMPDIRRRTAALRQALDRTARLRRDADRERRALAATRVLLERDMRTLAQIGSRLAAQAVSLRDLAVGLAGDVPSVPQLALVRPVRGDIVARFGDRTKLGLHSSGLTWRSTPGAEIRAAAAGRVAFAGPFRSYGRIVILEHGGGVLTLLAGFGTISVRSGEAVHAGAPLGDVGTDGELYFEVRSGGDPVDPAPWLDRKPG